MNDTVQHVIDGWRKKFELDAIMCGLSIVRIDGSYAAEATRIAWRRYRDYMRSMCGV